MTTSNDSVADRIQDNFERLTRAERQLAGALRENYPVSGLGSITTLAENAQVSTPTVVRMVRKLGFAGFPEFQAALKRELEAKISNPIAKHESWAENAPDEHPLNQFTEAVIDNIHQSLAQVDHEVFDRACGLLADPSRQVFIVGGRISRSLSDYFYMHLQMIRAGVHPINAANNNWPHSILDMKAEDVLVAIDMRRYENSTIKMAELAQERGVRLILFTDQWGSPVSKFADMSFSSKISVPSAWDSLVVTLLLMETMVADVQRRSWNNTRNRIEELEEIFDRTRQFRKFT
ncbi:MAG: MurR/RpiR family transcriptional regulator [Pseudomonadota bacterium]